MKTGEARGGALESKRGRLCTGSCNDNGNGEMGKGRGREGRQGPGGKGVSKKP
jgi:hypothetical protein